MDPSFIILLVVFIMSITLLFLEVFVIPGTTVFGIVGGIMLAVAVYYTYDLYGANMGHLSIGCTLVAFAILFTVGRRFMDDSVLTLKEGITAKVNKLSHDVVIGDSGKVYSDLRPNGKAIINGQKMEVFSAGGFIEKDIEIEIINIQQNKIIVKPLKS